MIKIFQDSFYLLFRGMHYLGIKFMEPSDLLCKYYERYFNKKVNFFKQRSKML